MTPDEIKARAALPVIVSPMFLVSGVDLVVEACKAGLIGSFPALNARTTEQFDTWLREIQGRLADTPDAAPFAVNIVLRNKAAQEQLEICRRHKVPLIITSVGDPADAVRQVHDWGGLVFHDVTNIRFAEKAKAAGVDGLILVCAGAGGHAGPASAFALAGQIRPLFDGLIIIGGGIADGHGILAAQALGADFAYMGTHFIASPESLADDAYKALLLDTDTSDIIYTDRISGLPASFIRQSLEANGLDPRNLPPTSGPLQPNLPDGVKAWKTVWSAGHGVGLIDKIRPVAEIAADLKAQYAGAKAAMARHLGAQPA